jgi:hypothetical protein
VNLDFADLVAKAKDGRISQAEKAAVAQALPSLGIGSQAYDALFVLGKAGDERDAPLVEPYLGCPTDPMLSRLALQILCRWWGLHRAYRSELLRFSDGVAWDIEDGGYVRLVARSAGGELARDSSDPAMVAGLMAAYANQTNPDIVRSTAYSALLRAAGKEWKHTPGVSSSAWRDDPDLEAIETLRIRLRGG